GVLPRRSRRRRGRRAAAEREISQVKLLDLSLGPHRIYPATPPSDYRASASIAALPSVAGLVSGFCSLSPSFGIGSLQIPPRGGHPGLASRFRSPRPAENLHLRDPKHAWQTKTAWRLAPRRFAPALTRDRCQPACALAAYRRDARHTATPAARIANTSSEAGSGTTA